MARPRNNITKLPTEIRLRICELIEDGRTYDEIRADETVKTALEERELAIHNSSLGAYLKSPEFKEYQNVRRKWGIDLKRRNIARAFVEAESGSDNIAKIANFELLKIIIEKLQSGGDVDPKELRSFSAALAAYERNRISAAKDKTEKKLSDVEANYQTEIAGLKETIAKLTEKLGSIPVDNSQTVAAMDSFVKGE
jgi:hypothetical protein